MQEEPEADMKDHIPGTDHIRTKVMFPRRQAKASQRCINLDYA